MNLPTIKQLRYFVALDKYRHFGKAARACFVSQPAFSVAIQELESTLNVQLVDRTNKNVTITHSGKEVAEQARLVIRDLEGLVELAKENQLPLSGQLNLGVIPTIAPFLLPGLLPKLRKSYPKLELYLTEDQTDRVYASLMNGDLDVILIALPYELKSVETMTLFRDHFYLACRKDTKLIDPDNYSIEQLPQESVLLLEDGHCMRDHALSACKIRNQDKISHVAASSLLTLLQMVDADLGVTFIPEMALGSSMLKNTQVKTWSIKPPSYREIGLVWRKGSMRTSEFKLLGEFIKKHHGAD
jgi:LysR family transcriptional regulator, hydrogen peroxide-inducible genes activator